MPPCAKNRLPCADRGPPEQERGRLIFFRRPFAVGHRATGWPAVPAGPPSARPSRAYRTASPGCPKPDGAAPRGPDGVVLSGLVETANKLQGLEFEVAFVWHPLAGLPEADGFHLDPGRLCAADAVPPGLRGGRP